MQKDDDIRIAFYKNGAVKEVLEKYEFSEKEKKLINDAIRTANMKNPRMKLIDEVDQLLKDVVKKQQPKIELSQNISASEIAMFEKRLTDFHLKKEAKKPIGKEIPTLGLKSKYGLIFFVFMLIVSMFLHFASKQSIEKEAREMKLMQSHMEAIANGTAK